MTTPLSQPKWLFQPPWWSQAVNSLWHQNWLHLGEEEQDWKLRGGMRRQQAGHCRWVTDARSVMGRLAPSPRGSELEMAVEEKPGKLGLQVEGRQGYDMLVPTLHLFTLSLPSPGSSSRHCSTQSTTTPSSSLAPTYLGTAKSPHTWGRHELVAARGKARKERMDESKGFSHL